MKDRGEGRGVGTGGWGGRSIPEIVVSTGRDVERVGRGVTPVDTGVTRRTRGPCPRQNEWRTGAETSRVEWGRGPQPGHRTRNTRGLLYETHERMPDPLSLLPSLSRPYRPPSGLLPSSTTTLFLSGFGPLVPLHPGTHVPVR